MNRERNLKALRFRGLLLTVSLVVQLALGICREILYWEDPRTVRTNVDNVIGILTLVHAVIISKETGDSAAIIRFRVECTFWILLVWPPVLILGISCVSLNVYYDLHSLSEFNVAMMTLDWLCLSISFLSLMILYLIYKWLDKLQPNGGRFHKPQQSDSTSICSTTEIKVENGIENLGTWF